MAEPDNVDPSARLRELLEARTHWILMALIPFGKEPDPRYAEFEAIASLLGHRLESTCFSEISLSFENRVSPVARTLRVVDLPKDDLPVEGLRMLFELASLRTQTDLGTQDIIVLADGEEDQHVVTCFLDALMAGEGTTRPHLDN